MSSSLSTFWMVFMLLLLLIGRRGLDSFSTKRSLDTDFWVGFRSLADETMPAAVVLSRLLYWGSMEAALLNFLSRELGTLFDSLLLLLLEDPKVGNLDMASETRSLEASFCCWKNALIFLMEGLRNRRDSLLGCSSLLLLLPFFLFLGEFFLEPPELTLLLFSGVFKGFTSRPPPSFCCSIFQFPDSSWVSFKAPFLNFWGPASDMDPWGGSNKLGLALLNSAAMSASVLTISWPETSFDGISTCLVSMGLESKCLCFGGGWGGLSKLSRFDIIEDNGDDDLEDEDSMAVPISGFCCILWDNTWSMTSDLVWWSFFTNTVS